MMLQVSSPQSSASVFVIGSPRSGTSAFSWALASHPDFWTSAESNFISHFFRDKWLEKQHASGLARGKFHWLFKNNVSYAEYAYYIGLGIDLLYQSRSQGKRWVEETPEYTLEALDFAVMFPSARFIQLVRDGREVTNSMIHSGFPVEWASDFSLACKTWVRFVEKGMELQSTYPDRVMTVRHENLVSDPQTQFEEIFKFLAAEFDAGPIDYLRTHKVNSSFSEGKKTTWRDWDKKQAKIFMSIAGPTMQKLGYTSE